MARIESRPPKEHLLGAPRLVRAPEKGALQGYITSEHQVVTATHHYQGRTECCNHEDCKMCMAGVRQEYHGYLAVWHPKSMEQCVIEVTPAPSDLIADWEQRWGKLRGCTFKLFRATEKSNGRVRIQLKEREATIPNLPAGIDLIAYLERLWGVVFETAQGHGENVGTATLFMQSNEAAMASREKALKNGSARTAPD